MCCSIRFCEAEMASISCTDRPSTSGIGNGTQSTGVPTPFHAGRLPLTPQNTNTPYRRPMPVEHRGLSGRMGCSIPGSGTTSEHGSGSGATSGHGSGSGATSGHGSNIPGSGGTSGRVSTRPSDVQGQGTLQICQQLLDEVRRGREEQKVMDDLKRMAQHIGKLEKEYKKLNAQLKEQADATFTVESSAYKVLNTV